MKWQEFWDYLSLQVWNAYPRKADLEEAKSYYPLTPMGEEVILQTGGGQLAGPSTGIAAVLSAMKSQSPAQATKPKATGILYPTIRRDSLCSLKEANFSRVIQKMELGRFPDPLLPFLVNTPDMSHWDAGFYLIRCQAPNYQLHVQLQYLQNVVGATLRMWQESQQDKNNEVSFSSDPNATKAGPFVGNEGLHELLQQITQARRQIRGGTWSGQMANYVNMANTPSYGFRRSVQLGVPKPPADLEATLEHLMTLNPQDFVSKSSLWVWIHIDKNKKGDLRDIHVVSVHNNLPLNVIINQVDSAMWDIESTMGPRWIGDPNSDLRPFMIDVLSEALSEAYREEEENNRHNSASGALSISLPSLVDIRAVITNQVSANAKEGDIIKIPLSLFSKWPDLDSISGQYVGGTAPLPKDRDLIHDIYAVMGWTDISVRGESPHPYIAQVAHPRLYFMDNDKEIPWSGNYQLAQQIKEAIVAHNIANPTKTVKPPLTDEQGTHDVDSVGEYPSFHIKYNENFLIPHEQQSQTVGHTGMVSHDSMFVWSQPRYYSNSGLTTLRGQLSWWLREGTQQLGNIVSDWAPNPATTPTTSVGIATQPVDAYIQSMGPYEVTDQYGTQHKEPNKNVALVSSNYQFETFIEPDGTIFQSSPSNRVDFAYSRVKGQPETIRWPAIDSEITGELYYNPIGFNLESIPDTTFTPFINWNKGFTRIVWEFIESSK